MPTTPGSESISNSAWDQLVEVHPRGHFLQASAWARLRSKQGWEARRVVLNRSKSETLHSHPPIGAQLLVRKRGPFRFAYVPRGPVCDPDDARLPALIEAIDDATEDCLFVRFEAHWPDEEATRDVLSGLGLRAAASVQPPSTTLLDLQMGSAALLAGMKQKWRYNIRLAGRKDVVVSEEGAKGLSELETLVAHTAQRNNFHARPEGYYRSVFESFSPEAEAETGGRALVYVARFQGKPLAAILVVHHGDTATYLYGGSGDAERNRMPNHALQWHAIEAAREAGLRWYDFWGIPDEIGQAHSRGESLESVPEGQGGLWGVWRFKRGFGGEVWRAVGAFDRVHAPLRYWLAFDLLPRIRRLASREEPDVGGQE